MAEAQNSVDVAVDRTQDAEDYALLLEAQNEALRAEIEAERARNRRFWPAVGASAGVSLAAGFLLCLLLGR